MSIPEQSTSREVPLSVRDQEMTTQNMTGVFAAMVLIFLIAGTVITAISRLP
jgi:hypothetical protein